jgi:hypothetical protein
MKQIRLLKTCSLTGNSEAWRNMLHDLEFHIQMSHPVKKSKNARTACMLRDLNLVNYSEGSLTSVFNECAV